MLELYVVVADCATPYEPGGGAFVQPTALVLPSWHQVTDGVKNAEVLAVKGPLRRFAPLTAPGTARRGWISGKGAPEKPMLLRVRILAVPNSKPRRKTHQPRKYIRMSSNPPERIGTQ